MIIHKLNPIANDDDFDLIAIHSSIEIYQIAYLINCKFNSKFIKSKRDIILSKEEAVFDKYEWEKTEKENIWFLFSNKFMIQKKTYENNLLFNSTNILQLFLINEHKNVDFFIKKNKDELTIPVINSINLISEISTAYKIHNRLKTPLIFD